jgi:hypothetical protein
MPALFLGNVNRLTEVTKGSLLWIDHCITYSFSENAPGALPRPGDFRGYRGRQRGTKCATLGLTRRSETPIFAGSADALSTF